LFGLYPRKQSRTCYAAKEKLAWAQCNETKKNKSPLTRMQGKHAKLTIYVAIIWNWDWLNLDRELQVQQRSSKELQLVQFPIE
jgi:hypothetical protein